MVLSLFSLLFFQLACTTNTADNLYPISIGNSYLFKPSKGTVSNQPYKDTLLPK